MAPRRIFIEKFDEVREILGQNEKCAIIISCPVEPTIRSRSPGLPVTAPAQSGLP